MCDRKWIFNLLGRLKVFEQPGKEQMCNEDGKEEQARGCSSISAISWKESRARFKLRITNPISIIPMKELAYYTLFIINIFRGTEINGK